MIRFYGASAFVGAWLVAIASAGAQDVRTQAPCSPVIDRTQGNVTINFTGGCTVGITPAQLKELIDSVLGGRAIPPELLDRYEGISRKFGVTDAAVTNFFRILGEKKVPVEDLDAKFREIAAQHLTLLKQGEIPAGTDPQIVALKKEALAEIGEGNYARAQTILQQAADVDLVAIREAEDAVRKAQDVAKQRRLSAAESKATAGRLRLAQLQYAAAADEYKVAADLVPASEPLIRADYLDEFGIAAYRAGKYVLASRGLTEALKIRQGAVTANDAEMARTLYVRALLYEKQGHYAEAEPLYIRSLALAVKSFGPDHWAVARNLNSLGELNRLQRRYADAEPLYKRALAITEKTRGAEHPDVGPILHNLALLYTEERRFAEAEPLYLRALDVTEKALGPEHPEVAVVLNSLGRFYFEGGRYAEAEPLYMRALSIGEKRLGPEHPDVGYYLENLARLYQAQGRLAESESFFKRALAIDEKTLGTDHPTTKSVRQLQLMLQHSIATSPGPPPVKPGP